MYLYQEMNVTRAKVGKDEDGTMHPVNCARLIEDLEYQVLLYTHGSII